MPRHGWSADDGYDRRARPSVMAALCQCILTAMIRIAVMGSGGLGGYFGALLARGGADVSFVARGRAPCRDAHGRASGCPGPCASRARTGNRRSAEIGVVDVAMVCVKLWDTDDALARMAPLVGPDTTVVSFQNGVLKEESADVRVWGAARLGRRRLCRDDALGAGGNH